MRMPAGKSVALLVMVPLEFFPLDAPAQPFRPTGGLDRPYPDTWGYANRDYGNRIGIYRLIDACARAGVGRPHSLMPRRRSTVPTRWLPWHSTSGNSHASGIDRGTMHFGTMDRSREDAFISEALETIATVAPNRVTGWQSPGQSESFTTLERVAAQGVTYVADWVNDDRPSPSRHPTAISYRCRRRLNSPTGMFW